VKGEKGDEGKGESEGDKKSQIGILGFRQARLTENFIYPFYLLEKN